jgi:Alpha galactosidase A
MESFAKKIINCLSLLLFSGFLFCAPSAPALENGLALTPPMGWNSWNRFACHVTEDLVKSAADALVSSGMKDAGYEYIVADAKTFPSGPKNLSLTLPLFGRPW